jgi:hypothetical protein
VVLSGHFKVSLLLLLNLSLSAIPRGIVLIQTVLADEIATAMRLLGVSKVDELGARHVRSSTAMFYHIIANSDRLIPLR